MPGPRILHLDIETSPNLVLTWGMWKQNINPEQVLKVSEVICWGAEWDDKPTKFYRSMYHDGKEKMLEDLWELLDDADIVVHYNGKKFDIPKINTDFLMLGIKNPPSPYTQVDLLETVHTFSFQFARLGFVCPQLKIGEKTKHTNFELWKKCLENDPKSWALMKKYNLQDVHITKLLYHRLLPWMKNHPRLYDVEERTCPYCNSNKVIKSKNRIAVKYTYTQFQCKNCGKYYSGNRVKK